MKTRTARHARWFVMSLSLVACVVSAQTKGGTMKLVSGSPPGTPVDALARTLATSLGASLGVTAIVDNKVGVNGNLAAEAVAGAAADGMTLLVAPNSVATINPFVYSKLKFNFVEDLVPIGHLGGGGYVLVANPATKINTVEELIQRAKKNPDALNYSSYGLGNGTHICMEMFMSMTGTRLKHVPYKSGTINDIIGGTIDLGFEPGTGALPFIQSGKLLAVGVSSGRGATLPDTPAIKETVPGYECPAWIGVFAPRKTPPAMLERINAAITEYLNTDSSYKSFVKTFGLLPGPNNATVPVLDKFTKDEAARWQGTIKKLSISLD